MASSLVRFCPAKNGLLQFLFPTAVMVCSFQSIELEIQVGPELFRKVNVGLYVIVEGNYCGKSKVISGGSL